MYDANLLRGDRRPGRGRVLRLRPGHTANFSGGAGYMPFIVFFSVPASIFFGLIGGAALLGPWRRLRKGARVEPPEGLRVPLTAFADYARRHLLFCVVASGIAGVLLFLVGSTMVYGNWLTYAPATFLLAVGPILAWPASTAVVLHRVCRRGPRAMDLVLGAVLHVGLLFLCFLLAFGVGL